MPAGAPAGDLLDDGPGVGGQLGSIVDDPELGVVDRHGDDLAAVSVADLEFDSGDHEAALAGDHPADVGDGCGPGGGWRPGEPGAVQPPAGSRWQRAGQGAGQDAAGNDLDELVADTQGDPLPGQVEPGAELLAADADTAASTNGPLNFDDRVRGQRAGWQRGRWRGPGWPAASGAQPGQVLNTATALISYGFR